MKVISLACTLLASIVAKGHATSKATCRANPDPHFRTWDNIYYDYHGGCDLVLIKNTIFPGGGLWLHIRTEAFPGWGGITNVALRIGSDTLEIKDDNTWVFNTVPGSGSPPGAMGPGGYAINHASTSTDDAWEILFPNSQYIRIINNHMGGPYVGRIMLEVYADEADFGSSVGLCGTWGTPGLIARDGTTDFAATIPPPLTDAWEAMGEEWQVDPPLPEPQLFEDAPLAGNCVPNPGGGNTELIIRENDAEEICEEVQGPDFANCVFDVMTTQNATWVDAPQYFQYNCVSRDFNCQRKGGECTQRIKCNEDTHYCQPSLCAADTVPEFLAKLDSGARAGIGGRRMRTLAVSQNEEEDSDNTLPGRRKLQDRELQRLPSGKNLSDIRNPCVCAIPRPFNSGKCCKYTGLMPFMCASIETLNPADADIDGHCNAVNGGNSCEWNYDDPDCCEMAMNDANCELPNAAAIKACQGCNATSTPLSGAHD